MLKRIVFRTFGIACGVGVLLIASRYPLGWVPLVIGLSAYAACLVYRPHAWLMILPAVLPVLNLYPWTGWLYVEELDLVVLATLAVGYGLASPARPDARLKPLAFLSLAILALSYLVSAVLPLVAYESWDWADAATYNTPLNSLRVLKGFAWALFLLPLLTRAVDALGPRYPAMLSRGMLCGLLAASAVVIWERWAYPGFLNFASDYRSIGSFFEAHVGGAAIDGYLALSLPFAAVLLLTARKLPQIALGAALLVVGSYAAFATFSRGLYAGIAIAVVAIGLLLMCQRPRGELGFRAVALVVAFGICAFMLYQVFATGGYRTLAAALGACAAGLYAGTLHAEVRVGRLGLELLAFCLVTFAIVVAVPKGAYLVYALSLLVLAATVVLRLAGRSVRYELTIGACAWLGINAIAVGWHWGGIPALQDAALAIAVVGVLALYNRSSTEPLWSLDWGTASGAIAAGLLLAIAIPVIGNYYMQTRIDTVRKDLDLREEHWTGTWDLRGPGWIEALVGAGLGRYPERYFWANPGNDTPGVLALMDEGERRFVRLASPRTPLGYGEPLRLSQRISSHHEGTLSLEITLRAQTSKSRLNINVCEKWLLYVLRCLPKPVWLHPKQEAWAQHSLELPSSSQTNNATRPRVFTITVAGADSVVDVAEVRLKDGSGRPMIANGNFVRAAERWYFSSDHVHLPWHAKNLWLGIWFDQGWMGLLSFLAFTCTALACALARAARGDRLAVALAASLSAFMVVGLFDTLLDATRLATLFYLLCACCVIDERMGSSPSTHGHRPHRSRRKRSGSVPGDQQ